mgnify:CR=1 FL=1
MENLLEALANFESKLEQYTIEVEEKSSLWKEKNEAIQKALLNLQKQMDKRSFSPSSQDFPLSIQREEILSLIHDIDACLRYLSEE